MKHQLLIALSLIVILTGCKNRSKSVDVLQNEVESVNAQCPLPLMPYGGVMKVEFDSATETAEIVFALNTIVVSSDSLLNNPEISQQLIQLICNMSTMNSCINALTEYDTSFRFVFDSEGMTPYVVELTSEELEWVIEGSFPRPDIQPLPIGIFE